MLRHDLSHDAAQQAGHLANKSAASGRGASHEADHADAGDLREGVEEAIADRPWVAKVARTGWIAKGVVYVLMGLTAFTIGRRRPTTDAASPEGAMGQIAEQTWGRALLAVLATGLVLYAVWRLLSAVMVSGSSPSDWMHRLGYCFSAVFYSVLAVAAIGACLRRATPDDPNTVEDLSQDLLGSMVGRTVLLAAGVITLGIGVYFIVKKGLQRSFLEELRLGGGSAMERRAVIWTGVVGWIGRGLVTSAVGWFVVQAAWESDRGEARGFDRALREVADTQAGMVVVALSGIALVVYGIFCFIGFRHMKLES